MLVRNPPLPISVRDVAVDGEEVQLAPEKLRWPQVFLSPPSTSSEHAEALDSRSTGSGKSSRALLSPGGGSV